MNFLNFIFFYHRKIIFTHTLFCCDSAIKSIEILHFFLFKKIWHSYFVFFFFGTVLWPLLFFFFFFSIRPLFNWCFSYIAITIYPIFFRTPTRNVFIKVWSIFYTHRITQCDEFILTLFILFIYIYSIFVFGEIKIFIYIHKFLVEVISFCNCFF